MEPISLDTKDRKLLYYLSGNARLSYSTLASNVGLSREAVKNRIERLVRERTILSFRVQTSHPYIGLEFYNLYISFARMDAGRQKKYENYIKKHPAVMWSNKCLGKWDYALLLLVKDLADFAEILSEFKDRFKGAIRDFEFDVILYEYVYTARLGAFFSGLDAKPLNVEREDSSFYRALSDVPVIVEKNKGRHELDTTDIKILELLSEDCRQTLHEISVKTGMPPENVRYRMRRMIGKHAIVAFFAAINYDMFDLHWYRIRMRTNMIDAAIEKRLRSFLSCHPSVFWAARSVGRADLHIDIRAGDNNALNAFLKEFNTKFGKIAIDYEALVMTDDHDYNNFAPKMYEVAADYRKPRASEK